MRFHRLVTAAFIAGGLLAVPHDSRAAADNTLGMALMAARVDADGTLLAGSGVTGVIYLGGGQYEIDFDRDVSKCFYSVTAYFPRLLEAEPRTINVKGVFVLIENNSQTAVDTRFDLTVFCNK
jgi:hypothetical protein